MRYHARIEISCLAGVEPISDRAREALAAALSAALRESDADFVVRDLTVAVLPDRTVAVSAALHGVGRSGLTSPLEALARLDGAFDRALTRTDLFEEFDVARKILRVSPMELAGRL